MNDSDPSLFPQLDDPEFTVIVDEVVAARGEATPRAYLEEKTK